MIQWATTTRGLDHLQPVIQWLEDEYDPNPQELFSISRATKHLWLCRPHLSFKEGILVYHRVGDSHFKLVVPEGNDEARPGCKNGLSPGDWQDSTPFEAVRFLAQYDSKCSCVKSKKPKRKPKAALGSYHAGIPMERVHMDLLGPLPPSRMGNRYNLVLVDQFTKWVEWIFSATWTTFSN